MIEIDGSHSEGGGQILRTALALSIITQRSFRIKNIRANRPQPGLKQQHLHCLKLIEKLTNAKPGLLNVGDTGLEFHPQEIQNLDVEIDIQTAGSITLLLQSVILPIIEKKKRKVHLTLIGGTDVTWSPQWDYCKEVILPQFSRYSDIECFLNKRGYYPKGQGKVDITFRRKKLENNAPLKLDEVGNLVQIRGVCHASRELEPAHVAERMEKTAKLLLQKYKVPVTIRTVYVNTESAGCGIVIYGLYSHSKETSDINFTDPIRVGADVLGERGVKAEKIAEKCARKLIALLDSRVPVDDHLCDNLIPLLGIYGGTLKTNKITKHTLTNIHTAEQFLDVKFDVDEGKGIITVAKEKNTPEEEHSKKEKNIVKKKKNRAKKKKNRAKKKKNRAKKEKNIARKNNT